MSNPNPSAPSNGQRSNAATDSSSCPTIRSFRSSKATAQVPTSGARACACSMPPSQKAYGGRKQIAWMEVFAGEKSFKQSSNWLPDETVDAFRNVPRRHQGAADDTGRRRHPIAERRAAAAAGSVRLSAAGALVPRRAVAGEASGKSRHGDLPREHRRHLRRHRVRRRARRRRRRSSISSPGSFRRSSKRSASARPRRPRAWQAQLEAIGAPKREVGVEVGVGLKPISRLGTERLVHSAIGYAVQVQAVRASRSCTRATS